MEHYESKLTYPITSPTVQSNEHLDFADNSLEIMTKNGLGLVNPEKVFNFYDELHSYLASAGINGVKVDVQNILETLGAGHGGRVSLARKFHRALEASISRNFPDNGIISYMSHNTDGLYSSKKAAVIRASHDIWPRDPHHILFTLHQLPIILFSSENLCSQIGICFITYTQWLNTIELLVLLVVCAIYVSDKPGQHDFDSGSNFLH